MEDSMPSGTIRSSIRSQCLQISNIERRMLNVEGWTLPSGDLRAGHHSTFVVRHSKLLRQDGYSDPLAKSANIEY